MQQILHYIRTTGYFSDYGEAVQLMSERELLKLLNELLKTRLGMGGGNKINHCVFVVVTHYFSSAQIILVPW